MQQSAFRNRRKSAKSVDDFSLVSLPVPPLLEIPNHAGIISPDVVFPHPPTHCAD
jgi:hypothetical protein